MLDTAVVGGELVDGTGAPSRRADLGIRDGRLVVVGTLDEPARRVIDADGCVVAPGFIDVHTHYDAQMFWDPYLTPSILHGVTSIVAGNCGFTIAPLVAEEGDYLRRLLAKVEGMPLESLEQGVPWDWDSTADFFERIDGKLGINAGFMVGHSTIRRLVMGVESTSRKATADELEQMLTLLSRGLAAGGLGFSSSWGNAHIDPNGDPVPSRAADLDELLAFARVCGEFEGTCLEFIPSGRTWEEASEAMIAMSVAAKRQLNWNLLRVSAAEQDATDEKLRAGTRAREAGGRVVALTMPQPMLMRYCFRSAWLLDTIPGWEKSMRLPDAEKLALLRDPVERRRLAELSERATSHAHLTQWADRCIAETFMEENKRFQGRLVGDIAAELGRTPLDTLLDIVCTDDLKTVFTNIPPEYSEADWEAQRSVWRDDRALIGASDAGAHLDFLSTFNLQTWFLQTVVREKGVVELEEAVHYFTSAPAALYGLRDRGELRVGACADVVVFDPDTIGSGPVHTRFDLPAGGGRLYAEAHGMRHVLVNGTEVVRGPELTHELPGHLIRSGSDTFTPPMPSRT